MVPSAWEAAVRIDIDERQCQGHARCNAVGPDVFDIDDLGYLTTRSKDVAEDLADEARKGAAACPERVITIR